MIPKYLFCIFAAFLLSFIQKTNAQIPDDSVKLWTIYPGYIVSHELDTTEGFILLSNLVANQNKAVFYSEPDQPDNRIKYKPKDIKAFKAGPRLYESFKFQAINSANTYHFFLKIIDGPMSLYRWYYEPESRSSQRLKIDEDNFWNTKIDLSFNEKDLTSQDILIKLDEKPLNLTALKFLTGFKKNMAKQVEDAPPLYTKIKNKEEGYTFGFQEDIIREYNQYYRNKHKK